MILGASGGMWLRHKLFAHKEVSDRNGVQGLFAKTNIREFERLLIFQSRLHEALWQLFHNGRKPVLRPTRYSVKSMREQPSPSHLRRTVQEQLTHETEDFLRAFAIEAERPVSADTSQAARR